MELCAGELPDGSINLTRAEVRKSVAEAKDAKSLYESALASDYK